MGNTRSTRLIAVDDYNGTETPYTREEMLVMKEYLPDFTFATHSTKQDQERLLAHWEALFSQVKTMGRAESSTKTIGRAASNAMINANPVVTTKEPPAPAAVHSELRHDTTKECLAVAPVLERAILPTVANSDHLEHNHPAVSPETHAKPSSSVATEASSCPANSAPSSTELKTTEQPAASALPVVAPIAPTFVSKPSSSPMVVLFDNFYMHLFAIAPEVKPLFRSSMQVQGKALIRIVSAIKNMLQSPDLVKFAAELAQRHVKYGIKLAYFNAMGIALMRTLYACSVELWVPETELAWRRVFGHVSLIVIIELSHQMTGGKGMDSLLNAFMLTRRLSARESQNENVHNPHPNMELKPGMQCPVSGKRIPEEPEERHHGLSHYFSYHSHVDDADHDSSGGGVTGWVRRMSSSAAKYIEHTHPHDNEHNKQVHEKDPHAHVTQVQNNHHTHEKQTGSYQ